MEDDKNLFTVSELTSKIKVILEENFRYVNIIGEISNFRMHSQSGHFYFTLKDDDAQIQAVMWKSWNQTLLFTPEDGMQVIVKGRVTLFPSRGTYQVDVREIKPRGAGELQARYEQLRRKLFEEGLFDDSFKKPLPRFPENVVLITSKTGAVLQDFIMIAARRYPSLKIYLYPVRVQGAGASEEIGNALKNIEKWDNSKELETDIVVIARGGGSMEDLWPFNDEKLARTIYSCGIPVVSAVGHEVDFTICDYVADLRAPTPSAAAEMITPDINELIENLTKISYFYESYVDNKLRSLRKSIKEIEGNYYFKRPRDLVYNFYQRLDDLSRKLENLTSSRISFFSNQLKNYKKTLYHVSPSNNLKKGYALIYKDEYSKGEALSLQFGVKKLVTRSKHLSENENVEIAFFDGKKQARVLK